MFVLLSTSVGLVGCGPVGLSGASTCSDFMKASSQDQQQIVSELAGKYQKPDYATPLGQPEIPYYCATHPKITLDQFFAAAG
jgi:hypothetical protein